MLIWCNGRGRSGRLFPVLPPPCRLNAACFGAMGAESPLLSCPPYTAVRVSAAHFRPLLLRFVRASPAYPTVRLGAALMLRFWWMVPFLPLSSIYAASWRWYCHHPTDAERLPRLTSGAQISISFAVKTPRQYIDLQRSFMRLSRPPPTSLPLAAFPTDNNMSTSDDARYSGRLRSSSRPNREAQETGMERLRPRSDSCLESRDSRWEGRPDEGSGDDAQDNTRGHRQDTLTDQGDSPVRKEKAEQPSPGSGASRRQLWPAPGERHEGASPR